LSIAVEFASETINRGASLRNVDVEGV